MNIWISYKPPQGSINKMQYKKGYAAIDCTIGKYSLSEIGPIDTFLHCKNLHNFMEYIKVPVYFDDNGPITSWYEYRKNGFTSDNLYTCRKYLYSYTDHKLTWMEERLLLKNMVKKYIDIKDLRAYEKIQLFDYYVPNLSTGFMFTEDKMINYQNYKYSHVYAIAEKLQEK